MLQYSKEKNSQWRNKLNRKPTEWEESHEKYKFGMGFIYKNSSHNSIAKNILVETRQKI
jgi:hypothetical protein